MRIASVVIPAARPPIGRIVALGVALLLAAEVRASAQSEVRAWYANGQVWVVWTATEPAPETYEIHRSPQSLAEASAATLAGRLFAAEWRGERLSFVDPALTWSVPDGTGGIYTLAPNEGVFAFTPHHPGADYFAVVGHGATAIGPSQRTAEAVAYPYDPFADPVEAHLQWQGEDGGHPLRLYAHWIDGRDDPQSGRPDLPVMGNRHKNGSPHVFLVAEPQGGAPAGLLPATLLLHGGGGQYWAWRPLANKAKIGIAPTLGLTVAHDDIMVRRRAAGAQGAVTGAARPVAEHTWWFGYVRDYDPFVVPPPTPPDDAVLVGYTLRRLDWINDWLIAHLRVDPDRIAIAGHSMGGAGVLANARWRPERYASGAAFNPGLDGPSSEKVKEVLGAPEQNLLTDLVAWDGRPVRTRAVWHGSANISATSRDFPLLRVFVGKLDVAESAAWGPVRVEDLRAIDAGGWGSHLYWDERQHPVADWEGHWSNSTAQTARDDVDYQARYRASQSFPAFYGDDQNLLLPLRQPDPGLGTPADGDPHGTWGGYFDWELDTLVDTSHEWQATVFLAGASAGGVDEFPGERARAHLSIRKAKSFQPAPGSTVTWTAARAADGLVLQSGAVVVAADGLVAIRDLEITKDPDRLRVAMRAPVAVTEIDDGDPAVEYRRGWHRKGDDGATGGAYHRRIGSPATGTGAPSVRLVFTAEEVTLLHGVSSSGGEAGLYLDGRLERVVSFLGEGAANGEPAFGREITIGGLGAGSHELVLEQRQGAAYVDGFRLVSASAAVSADESAPQWSSPTEVLTLPLAASLLQPVAVTAADEELSVLVEGRASPVEVRILDPLGVVLAIGGALVEGSATAGADAALSGAGLYGVALEDRSGGGGPVTVSVARTRRR